MKRRKKSLKIMYKKRFKKTPTRKSLNLKII